MQLTSTETGQSPWNPAEDCSCKDIPPFQRIALETGLKPNRHKFVETHISA